jgi:hypothetical protein
LLGSEGLLSFDIGHTGYWLVMEFNWSHFAITPSSCTSLVDLAPNSFEMLPFRSRAVDRLTLHKGAGL